MKRLFLPCRQQINRGFWVLLFALAIPQLLFRTPARAQEARGFVNGVEAIGITVSDMDRAVDFYSKVLTFEKVSDEEVAGDTYERLEGVFGLRMRVFRMQLGDEFIELTEYLAPKGRPFRWTHAATIAGFSTLRSSLAIWTRHTPVCDFRKWSMHPRAATASQTGTRMRLESRFLFQRPR